MNTIKRSVLFFAFFVLAASVTAVAQGGGFQRRTVEERVKRIHDKLDSAFKLESAKLAKADSAFASYYRASDKMRDDAVAAAGGGQPDFQGMRDKMQPLTDARDKELKAILGDDNFKKFKDEIEPSLRGGRGGGGGGGNR